MTFYITTRPVRRWTAEDSYSQLPLNIHEEGEAYVLTAPVPGLKAEDLNIQVLDDVVSIEGEYKIQDGDYLLREFPYGNFRRSLRLPAMLAADQAEASITDGVLTLRVPKAESARPKMIKVISR